MANERYLLELEDKIEEGVMELLTSDTGPDLAANLWQSIDVDPQLALFVIGVPKYTLIGRLPKNYPLYHRIQPDGDVDILAITCEFDLAPEEVKARIEAEGKAHPGCRPSSWYKFVEMKLLAESPQLPLVHRDPSSNE